MSLAFPTLKTNSLLLRQIVDDDLLHIFQGLSNPLITEYYAVSFDSLVATKEQMDWFKNLEETSTGIWWAITSTDEKNFYGAIGFNNLSQANKKAELGFWLLPEHWGKGIMKNAIELVCNYAYAELKLHRIEALVETENRNSKSILLKSSFDYEGTMVDCEIKNGKFISLESYAKLH